MGFLEEANEEAERLIRLERFKLVEELRAATPIDTGEARANWRLSGHTIINDREYIDKLNKGSSKQAPAHFIEKTLLSHTGVTPSGTIVRSK